MSNILPWRFRLCLLGAFTSFSALTAQIPKAKYSIHDKQKIINVDIEGRYANNDITYKDIRKLSKYWHKYFHSTHPKYQIRISCAGVPIEYLVDGYVLPADSSTIFNEVEFDGTPWVQRQDCPFRITNGLQNRHVSLWASHGRYFDQTKGFWKFQRPFLFGTTEDLFTQTIVVPYLIPMLENSGCVVFSPRERDWQEDEYIVDNDNTPSMTSTLTRGVYTENASSGTWHTTDKKGFAFHPGVYIDGENPFTQGTARFLKTSRSKHPSTITYQPQFQTDGNYAVYVSYQSLPKSVSDAEYIVTHEGRKTTFKVNQKMGGGTWVYLGTFRFKAGCSSANSVMLTNSSRQKGFVTADAVRFGGGMGNIQRSGAISGLPRAIEGARYYAQWAGAPYKIYSSKNGLDDYGDDINVRPLMTNWLAGGSCFNPTSEGLKVPIVLALAIHSDAGTAKTPNGLIGSLAICTTEFNDGVLASGTSRELSYHFAKRLLDGLDRDLPPICGKWNRRYLWDRNYAETRTPEVPSAILETMSHQNFADMLLGEDPHFRFAMARSIYKSILRFINDSHGRPSVVQPLAPKNFRVEIIGDEARLSWTPDIDKLEPTAIPTSYNVYTSTGALGFDNGRNVEEPSLTVKLEPGVLYSFKITAANRGGESFATPVLSAIHHPGAKGKILIVDGFTRLSAPAVVRSNGDNRFDMDEDPGVSFGMTAQWNNGQFIMGNEFDNVATHAEAMSALTDYDIESTTLEAVENHLVTFNHYALLDLILGLQRDMPYALKRVKALPKFLQAALLSFAKSSKALLVSGAYIGTDMQGGDDTAFLKNFLKVRYEGRNKMTQAPIIHGLNMDFDIYRQLNKDHYAATSVDVLAPDTLQAADETRPQAIMMYNDSTSAAVGYRGSDYTAIVMGFPFETIASRHARKMVMQGLLNYALKPSRSDNQATQQ